MGLVYLQANDGRAAIRNFDAVASQGLPVALCRKCAVTNWITPSSVS